MNRSFHSDEQNKSSSFVLLLRFLIFYSWCVDLRNLRSCVSEIKLCEAKNYRDFILKCYWMLILKKWMMNDHYWVQPTGCRMKRVAQSTNLYKGKCNYKIHPGLGNIYALLVLCKTTIYSKTGLIWHLCNPFPCVIRHWFSCPFDNFSVCFTL